MKEKINNNNYPLGKFRLLNLPSKKKDEVNVEVIFELDEDSIIIL